MPTCIVCGMYFSYNEDQGYSKDLCSPFCDGRALERNRFAGDKAVLDELHSLLDCIQTDGLLSGLDEIHPDSTLGRVLYDLMVAYEDLVKRNMRERP